MAGCFSRFSCCRCLCRRERLSRVRERTFPHLRAHSTRLPLPLPLRSSLLGEGRSGISDYYGLAGVRFREDGLCGPGVEKASVTEQERGIEGMLAMEGRQLGGASYCASTCSAILPAPRCIQKPCPPSPALPTQLVYKSSLSA